MQKVGDEEESSHPGLDGNVGLRDGLGDALDDLFGIVRMLHAPHHAVPHTVPLSSYGSEHVLKPLSLTV